MHEFTDEEIAVQVQHGDIESFSVLDDRYQTKIERYARRFLFITEDIEDLVQEVFIKAYVNIKSFDVGRKFSSWLYRIAHNEFINALKKRGREKVAFVELDALLPHLPSHERADSDVERAQMRSLLERSLGTIPAKYREPLILFYFEDMDYKEIADILHIPVATVGVRLRRGRATLQVMLKRKGIEYGTS